MKLGNETWANMKWVTLLVLKNALLVGLGTLYMHSSSSYVKVMCTQRIRYACVFGLFFILFIFYWSYPRRQNCVASRNLRWNINKNMIDNQAFTDSIKIIRRVCAFYTTSVYIAPQVHCSSSRKQLIQI